jgi:predicted O-methyltransferase YrrM
MPMNDDRWRFLTNYPSDVFGVDPQLEGLMERAVAAGLPPIAVSAGAGQLLRLLVSMTAGHLAIEIGTLGGYSGIWIARGLADEGRLVTMEFSDHHAEFARSEFDEAGVGDRVEIIRGPALDNLPTLAERLGPESVDFAFIDAVKGEYIDYFEAIKPMVTGGGLVTADNVYGTGKGWLDEGHGTDAFNRHVASDPGFEATTVPVGGGLLIARKL